MLRPVRIEKVNDPEILIISDTLDYSTDFITVELYNRKSNYLRVNRDEFADHAITFDIDSNSLIIEKNGSRYTISDEKLKSIYFRAPIYLRDIYQPNIPEQKQLFRTQWGAFVRNLSILEKPLWVNNPIATFKAENKQLQLKYARDAGFNIPWTIVTNHSRTKSSPLSRGIAMAAQTLWF